MQKQIEQYLNQATRGLWGKKRQQVKEELHSHIHEKMHFHMAFGHTEEEALTATLQSLGAARAVNAGLLKLHGPPALARMAVATCLLSSVVLTQAQNLGQLQVLSNPSACFCDQHLTDQILVQDLIQLLKGHDAEASIEHIPQYPNDTLVVKFKGEHHTYRYTLSEQNGSQTVSLHEWISSLAAKEHFSIKGLLNPEITYNTFKFKMIGPDAPYSAAGFYFDLLGKRLKTEVGLDVVVPHGRNTTGTVQNIRVQDAPDGEVYVLLQKLQHPVHIAGKATEPYELHVAEAHAGKLEFRNVQPSKQFTTLGSGDAGDILLRLSGEFHGQAYTSILPAQEDLIP